MTPTGIVFLFLVVTQMGCLCWFLPCDRRVHVGGQVRDAEGTPIADAIVEFYGQAQTTDANGCFLFSGALAAPGFQIRVEKPGFKTYVEAKRFKLYDIDVVLEAETSARSSRGTWRALSEKAAGMTEE